jgi:serine/threonine protein phosphatase PrpC
MPITDQQPDAACRATASTVFPTPTVTSIDVTVGGASHTGLVRPNNEDHYAAVRRTRSRQILCTNVDIGGLDQSSQHAYVLIVADGVGGHECGELASELVLQVGWDVGSRDPSWIMKFDSSQWSKIREQVEGYAREIQNKMREDIRAHPQHAGMATTWTCACVLDTEVVIAYAGDSRAYLFRGGDLRQLTRDQTFAQELQDRGVPAEQTARFKNSLTNSFGGANEEVFVEVHHVPLADGDRLLLCTDGLSNMARDDEIAATLSAVPTPQAACDQLIELALRHGGTDNVTVIVADIHSTPVSESISG